MKIVESICLKAIFLIFSLMITSFVSSQDIIYKRDGTEISAKIIEITTDLIKYRAFEQQSGPIRNMSISEVFMIIYEDGTKENFKIQSDPEPIPQDINESRKNNESITTEPASAVNNQHVSGGMIFSGGFVKIMNSEYWGVFLRMQTHKNQWGVISTWDTYLLEEDNFSNFNISGLYSLTKKDVLLYPMIGVGFGGNFDSFHWNTGIGCTIIINKFALTGDINSYNLKSGVFRIGIGYALYQ